MKQELRPLLQELCQLVVIRNTINTRRHRARFRKNYYENAVRAVEAHNRSNWELRQIHGHLSYWNNRDIGDLTAENIQFISNMKNKEKEILAQMESYRKRYPKPKKWQAMGLHKLRSLVLQGEGEYAMAKHETMEYSIKHRNRLKFLTTTLKCSLTYDNGGVTSLNFGTDTWMFMDKINKYAEQYQANKAVEEMLK